jgi:hypothetical protein
MKELDKSDLMDAIEDIQVQVSELGFMGSNEIALWERDMIADYIISLNKPDTLPLEQSAQLILSKCVNYTFVETKKGK